MKQGVGVKKKERSKMVKVVDGFDHPNFVKAGEMVVGGVGKKGEWRWCLHCEKAFPAGTFRVRVYHDGSTGVVCFCPYKGCSGDIVFDGSWTWKEIRKIHPEYPKIPEEGIRYPKD